MAKYQIWKSDKDGDYYWHLWSDDNHKVVSRSSEGYETKQGARKSIAWVKANADADVEEL